MKAKLMLLLMVLFLSLTACSQDSKTQNGKEPNRTDSGKTDQGEKEPDVTEDEEKDSDVTDEEDTQDEEENKQFGNDVFKEVSVSTLEDGSIVLRGKARVFEGVFQYAVVSGTEILLENNYQTEGAPAWGNFDITIDKEYLIKEKVSIELFVYSAKDGAKTDILTIPIK
ncbi:Gmad2 immunoglobulin-like domain-containing protein [Neobacillus niacini]|uniref:Gmad2 immunoglobulin-like domain-containing protein n=1 Tax=Neobacillus niacini TaxID=86668 RepID=UPI0007AB8DB1|nr:Gmad2 immunoglobulin-like domain-containing protein [Neobacillus niacini]MEC1525818.1 Gmad2 immunoglobulin-like domain-containing protein [Neobacillus niacini]